MLKKKMNYRNPILKKKKLKKKQIWQINSIRVVNLT